jgi:hypothetical protein
LSGTYKDNYKYAQSPSPPKSNFLHASNTLCNATTLHHRNTTFQDDNDVHEDDEDEDEDDDNDMRINQTLSAMEEEEETTHALDLEDASSSRTKTTATAIAQRNNTSTSSMELLVSKLYALHPPPIQQIVPLYPAAVSQPQPQQQQQQQQPPVRLLDYNDRANSNSTTSDLSSGTGAAAWCWYNTTSDQSDLIIRDGGNDNVNDNDDNDDDNVNDNNWEHDEEVGQARSQVPPFEFDSQQVYHHHHRISKDQQHLKQQAAKHPSDADSKQAAATSRPSPERYPESCYATSKQQNNNNNTTTTPDSHLYSYTRDDDDASHTDDNSMLSAIPLPPALQQGLHYSVPGAFRMSTLGARLAIMDESSITVASASSISTSIRSMPPQPPIDPSDDYAIEARLHLIGGDGLTLASTTNGAEDDDDDDDNDNNDCLEELPNDEPMPSPPCAAVQYTVSLGGNSITTFGTTRTPIVEAEPLDEHHALRAFFSNKKVQFVLCVLLLVFLVLAVGTTHGMTGFAGNFVQNPTYPPKQPDEQDNGIYSGASETTNTVAPTLDATVEGDLDLSYFVYSTLPKATKVALEKDDSAQSLALRWLRQNNTHLLSYSTTQRLQRFSLATFFYATGGAQKWRLKTKWLTDADECEWFTTANTTVCNKDGMYHTLSLDAIGLRGTIPPELEFLTSLSVLEVPGNVLTGSIPSNVGRMTNLRELLLCKWCGCRWGCGLQNQCL